MTQLVPDLLLPDVVVEALAKIRNEPPRGAHSEGHTFVLTNRGVPVGRIVLLDAPAPTLTIVRPAKRVGGWVALRPQPTDHDRPMTEVIDEIREDRL